MIRLSLLLLCSVCVHTVWAVEPHEAELKNVDDWVRASFAGEKIVPSHDGYLEVTLEHGSLLKNTATTKVYHKQLGSLPMKIHRKTYQHGLYLPSPGTIRVVLPSAARRFDASFGIDSNRVTSFYSNAGRGSVIGMVSIGERQVYVTRKMQEGMPGEKVSVPLEGATSFTLTTKGHAEGIIEQVDFNQSDWADAVVELMNGREIRLGDLPTSPLGNPPKPELPFSFRYAGQDSQEVLKNWEKSWGAIGRTQKTVENTVRFRDPVTGLVVECEFIVHRSLPVVEWALKFINASGSATPLIENVLPLDLSFERDAEGEFTLHHSNGSPHSLVRMSDETDYAPRETVLGPEAEKELASMIGLPASNDLPFFNVEWSGQGAVFAIGWPGQWHASFTRDKMRTLEIKAGQQNTAFFLKPGEQVQTPRIAMLLWQGGDWLRAQNLWRRWMIESNLPRTGDGALPPFQHNASSSAHYIESSGATEANQKMFVDRYVDNGIKPDYWWIDAGWYDYSEYWLNVGSWNPNQKRFPNSLKPVSDYLHNRDMKFILWFTPELVTRGSEIDQHQSQWLLKGGAEWWMGHALIQGEFPAHVNDSGMTLMEDVVAFGTGNPDSTATSKKSLADGEWHLVTATRFVNQESQRSELKVFVDGELSAIAESENLGLMNKNDSFGVGRQYQTRGVVGEIDDVRIYDLALSPEQVGQLHAHTLELRPLHHYPFDGNVRDVTGNVDGDKIGSGEFQYVQGVRGGTDQALAFNNDYGVKIPNSAHANYTLSCWVRMDAPQAPPWGRGDMRLFNFGDSDAAAWMTEYIDSRIKSQGVDLYRHDGIPPLSFWNSNDEPGRRGISEMKHVAGLLGYWDTLRERHPMLRIDICSGGGSRNELETLRRAVPLWRSDYAYETTGMQTLTYGMALWIPFFGTGVNTTDPYTFWSQLAPSNTTTWDVRRSDFDFKTAQTLLAQRREVISYYYDDYYPLTKYRTDNDVWMAWQFHRPSDSSGVVMSFRRPESPASQMQFKLRGLDFSGTYVIKEINGDTIGRVSGAKLEAQGLSVTLPTPRSAAVYKYRKIK